MTPLHLTGRTPDPAARMDECAAYLELHTPGGSQTASKAPGKAGPRGGGYPSVLSHGHGSWVFDEAGRCYLDLVASLAAVGLGHSDRAVVRAVEQQLRKGSLLSLPTLLEGAASERLCAATGWAEQARWVKTGSEATEAAVRVARAATRRDRVLTVRAGYHSWHSWFQAVKPEHPGVPDALTALIDWTTYGSNIDQWVETSLRSLDAYACVILEPAPITGGGDGAWLEALRAACTDAGTLLVFDEVVWGFRLARAGGTEHFGVVPDLATYGKALGNGVPVGALVGRRDLMQHARLVSGTFGGDTLGLAAALAVMRTYEREPVVETLWERGTQLMEGVNALHGPVKLEGYPVHPVPVVSGATPDWVKQKIGPVAVLSLFLQELAGQSVLAHPAGWNMMYAHTRAHVERAVRACEKATAAVQGAINDGRVRESLRGVPFQAAFTRRT